MTMRVLIIDDEWEHRKSYYDKLKNCDPAISLDIDYLKTPGELSKLLNKASYDAFIIDVVLKLWGDVNLNDIIKDIEKKGPIALVSGKWDETGFREVAENWHDQNIQQMFQWEEFRDPYGRKTIIYQFTRMITKWHELVDIKIQSNESIKILHLSDLQFGGFEEQGKMLESNICAQEILRKWKGGPHFIVITGDIAERGLPKEYAAARMWLKKFIDGFGWELPSKQIMMVEGNHDCCLPLATASRIAYDQEKGCARLEEDNLKNQEDLSEFGFAPFQQFALQVTGDEVWKRQVSSCWLIDRYRHLGVLFFGCNSSYDTYDSIMPRSRINSDKLQEALEEIIKIKRNYENIITIGMVHHSPFSESEDRGVDNYKDFEKMWLSNGIPNIVLHGHVHSRRCYRKEENDKSVIVVCAPTPTKRSRPEDAARGFNMVELERQNERIKGMRYVTYAWEINSLKSSSEQQFSIGDF